MKLRTQLTLAVTAVAVVVVALAGLFITMRADRLAAHDVDRALTSWSDEVSAAAGRSGTLPAGGTYAVRLIQNGKVRAKAGPAAAFPVPGADGYTTVTVGGHRWRSLTRTLASGTQLEVLRDLNDVDAAHTRAVLTVDLAVVLAGLLAAAGAWYLAGLSPRPAAAAEPSPTEPEPEPTPKEPEPEPSEPEPQKPEPADHDLRLPLANLGVNLETLLSDPDLPATQRHLLLAAMADEHTRIVAMLDDRG
jgi:hypothetical protein